MEMNFKKHDAKAFAAVKTMVKIKRKNYTCEEISELEKEAYEMLDNLLFDLGIEMPDLNDDYFVVWYNQNYEYSEDLKDQIGKEVETLKPLFKKYIEEEVAWINMVNNYSHA